MMNIINGGAHANNTLAIQEFMIIPTGVTSFAEGLRLGVEVFYALKKQLQQAGQSVAVGDEGGFAPDFVNHEAALDAIMQAIEQAGFKPGGDIHLALDVASSEFYQDNLYSFPADKQQFTAEQFCQYLKKLVANYPIVSIEDGMAENDWQGWQYLTEVLGQQVQLVGDDLFVTHQKLLQRGIDQGIANAILIKPNQIGTLSETFAVIRSSPRILITINLFPYSNEMSEEWYSTIHSIINSYISSFSKNQYIILIYSSFLPLKSSSVDIKPI